jgi:hypothetical protein
MTKAKSGKLPAANFIKTCFKTVTVEDLLRIKAGTPRAILAALSSLTPEELRKLKSEEVLALYELVSYIDDPAEIALALPPDYAPPAFDVASASFEKAELAKIKIGQLKEPYRLLPELVRIYLGADYMTGPAAVCLATGALILQDLTELFERFKDLGGEKPTEEQEEAGIAALHTFGPYGIVESIAAKYHVRPYDVFQWSAEEVYLELTYQLAKSRYQENLREIENRKNQTPKK